MLDIIFISYDEPNADANFNRLISRFPHARRVHGVKGIANAHFAAARKSLTRFFYVVDADAQIRADFDFSFKPDKWEENYVHLWYAHNPIGLTYGYGGVKLFNKSMFKEIKTQLDFTTTFTKDIKIHKEVACNTIFNSDEMRAFRGSFREATKLSTLIATTQNEEIREDAKVRLTAWLNPADCAFREYIVMGANAGVDFAATGGNLSFVNEHVLILEELKKRCPTIDFHLDPIPKNEMKREFFFTSRIAAALYDPAVLDTLPITELRDVLSDGQLFSKNWLVEKMLELKILPEEPRIAILGGWIGSLALLINVFEFGARVTSIDLDARANRIAEKLNYDFPFNTITADMYELDYTDYDVIINTSSEHIEDIEGWREKIPDGKILVVQNNNFEAGDGHVSCVRDSHELRTKLGLKEVFYEGTREFPQYKRFMLIGRT